MWSGGGFYQRRGNARYRRLLEVEGEGEESGGEAVMNWSPVAAVYKTARLYSLHENLVFQETTTKYLGNLAKKI